PAFVFSDLMDLDDVRVADSGDHLGLQAKARRGLARPDHLQGDVALEARLPGFVHDSHPAFAERRYDFVARNVWPSQLRLERRLELVPDGLESLAILVLVAGP